MILVVDGNALGKEEADHSRVVEEARDDEGRVAELKEGREGQE